jgi:integrase
MANAPIGSVSPAMVSRWVREMLAAGLAPSTVRLRLNRLSGVFTHAMRLRLVTFNPAAGLGPRDGDKAVAPPLEPEDAVALLGFSRGSMVEVPVALALGCGLRRGEVLGLRWADVDFEAEELHVRQALRADGAMGPPKTVAGRRTVPMPDFVVESLRGHLASQRKHRLVMGPRWSDHDLVCPTLMGGPQPVRSFWNRWEQFRQAHRLTLRFHDLRHAYATLMGESGADITDLKELMGHSRASVTMDMYQKALGRKKRRRVDAFGDLMRGE